MPEMSSNSLSALFDFGTRLRNQKRFIGRASAGLLQISTFSKLSVAGAKADPAKDKHSDHGPDCE
jgi:hypothetical protein